jgi:hypothetical protein
MEAQFTASHRTKNKPTSKVRISAQFKAKAIVTNRGMSHFKIKVKIKIKSAAKSKHASTLKAIRQIRLDFEYGIIASNIGKIYTLIISTII